MTTPPRTSDEIREAFISFFRERGHVLLPPWPLVPIGDPTSMFTSAGMQQFKPQFMGEQPPAAPRVVTVQRCFRTTDIEEVGDTSHLTAFEMLGNFSFGDYFKREAIHWAWELLTTVYRLDPARLHATIYLDDEDSYRYWREVGLPDDHIHRRDEDLNYWFSFPKDTPGASGPCGPDSEIYYDLEPHRDPAEARLHTGPDGRPAGVGYSDRFLEIWNLVFMQLYQHPDGRRTSLPAQNIDTGSGLERVAMVLQGKRSVFETDIFLPILAEAQAVVGVDYLGGAASELQAYAIRAMAEHCRAATLLIGDGVVPSNEGRGYVLRRIIRRAIYFARKVGVREPFTARLAAAAIGRLGVAYPHLVENEEFIRRAIAAEEERFTRTLEAGTARLEALLERLRAEQRSAVPGEEAFTLYDTFGLPVELTREIAAAEGFTVDDAGFQSALEAQRQRARQHTKFLLGEASPLIAALGEAHSEFVGYTHTSAETVIAAILRGGALADLLTPGQEGEVILATTPFYPEGGGQLGDRGNIVTPSGVFSVEDTQAAGGAIVHRGRVAEGELRAGQRAHATVDLHWRSGAARNHTGTHILHAALRAVLGTHVRQQGSLVSPDRLRFDFTHLEQTPRSALLEVQQLANEKVRHDLEVQWRTMAYRQAIEAGALAFFGDKYGSEVRVVEIRDDGHTFSAELCGGTHVHHTGQIGFIHIIRESAVAAGTRRIEAVTGEAAEAYLLEQQERLLRIADRLNTSPSEIEERLDALTGELERLRRQAEQLARLQTAAVTEGLLASARQLGDSHLVVARVEVASADLLRDIADRLRGRLKSALVVLAAEVDGRPAFLAAATPDLVARGVHAGNIIRAVAQAAGGGGGGRPDLAQAGAKDTSRIDEALAVASRLGSEALGT
ncbi:alanine--tRNA ligase [Tepidiforma sp.]|uniref:alanine--tRNA ligase n=1 Tax=Tepidiforma sp. TaxID=2682230 RepID=UPI002ADD8B65|nr:alanine--tRNA ligase [Tepidiforma sp.]